MVMMAAACPVATLNEIKSHHFGPDEGAILEIQGVSWLRIVYEFT